MINFFYTDEYLKHDTGQHPESIERIKTVKKLIFENYKSHNFLNPPLANKEIIYNVHEKEYVDYIFDNIPDTGFSYFDPDTVACPNSLNSYLSAVGGSVEAVNQINLNKNKKVFFVHTVHQDIMLKKIKRWGLVYLTMSLYLQIMH